MVPQLPDVTFYDTNTGDSEEQTTSFQEMEMFVEFKNGTDPFETDGELPFEKLFENTCATHGQIILSSTRQQSYQFCISTFSVGMFGNVARLFCWDHGGATVNMVFCGFLPNSSLLHMLKPLFVLGLFFIVFTFCNVWSVHFLQLFLWSLCFSLCPRFSFCLFCFLKTVPSPLCTIHYVFLLSPYSLVFLLTFFILTFFSQVQYRVGCIYSFSHFPFCYIHSIIFT